MNIVTIKDFEYKNQDGKIMYRKVGTIRWIWGYIPTEILKVLLNG